MAGPTHQIEVDGMVHEIVLPGLDVRRRREVYSIGLANVFDLIPCPCQSKKILVELSQVSPHDLGGVSRRIA